MKAFALFLCFCIIASSQVFAEDDSSPEDSPENKVPLEDEAALAARPFRKSDCALDVELGDETCRALIPVYKWSIEAKKCVDEFYGGCHPSKNNFKTKAECEKIATPICSQLIVIKKLFLPYSLSKVGYKSS
uniref:Tissue factor pathway inhibitor-like n=1 Tax=Diabrotica virgifera virgifera TaxID=50390 RepID=A0A6P7F194_DIAVI